VVSEQKVAEPESKSDVWRLFLYAMKSPITRDKYQRRLSSFFRFAGVQGVSLEENALSFIDRAAESSWAFSTVLAFLEAQKARVNNGEISGATVRNYVKAIKLFCEMADIPIPWKKLTRGLPRGKSFSDDRIPSMEEIKRLMEYPDRRIKGIVCTMTSSGIRLGAWDYLRWGNIHPIEMDGKVVAAQIIVYAGEPEQYFSYISEEAWQELNKWIKYRELSGEKITEDSWLMRDLWDTRVAQGRGLVSRPKKLASLGVKRLIERAIWAQGLRTKLAPGKKRHPFQANHFMRKWMKTRCEIGGMKPINVETLLSHSLGVSNSYWRRTPSEILDDYLKVQDFLLLGTEHKLQQQVLELQEKNRDSGYKIRAKLEEKDRQMKEMSERYDSDIALLKDAIYDMQQLLKNPHRLFDISKDGAL
jgi:hypothetical protein